MSVDVLPEMSLITPSRLQALVIVGGLTAMCAQVFALGNIGWTDVDSVPRLSDARACELALAQTSEYERGECKVERFDDRLGVVRVGRNYVCFLRGARWFVALNDGVTPEDCPSLALGEDDTITSLDKEVKLEASWSVIARGSRDTHLTTMFRENVRGVGRVWRMSDRGAPATCPDDLIESEVEAVDMNLLLPSGHEASWHYLTSDRIGLALSADQYGAPFDVRMIRRDVEYLLLVDARERRQPARDSTGFISGRLALVDWKKQTLLCETDFELDQSPDSAREADAPAPYMQSFKEQVSGLLTEKVSVMSNQRLKLLKTW
ncbi:MAG: hypothetical protein QM817_34525 [Archangium sp.]